MKLVIHPEEHLDERGQLLLFTASHKALSIAQVICIPAGVVLHFAGFTEAPVALLAMFFVLYGLQRFYMRRLRMMGEYEDALTLSARTHVSRASMVGSWMLVVAVAFAFEIREWRGWSSVVDALLMAVVVNFAVWFGQRNLRNRKTSDEVPGSSIDQGPN